MASRMIPFVDLKAQYDSIKPEMDKAVQRVLSSGWYLLGEETSAFEKEFASYLGTRHCAACGNGTQAIEILLKAHGIRPGDEVITVSHTAFPTVLGISNASARPVFAEIGENYLINPARIEEKISEKTKAIVPVHLYGQCCDMKPIMEIAEKHSLTVIEDACQAHGAEFRGKKAGVLGHSAAFSFYPTKNLGAYGDAGLMVSRDSAVIEKARMLLNIGRKSRCEHECVGLNARISELQSAVLRVKLKRLDKWVEKRRNLAAIYGKEITARGIRNPILEKYGKHAFYLYVVRAQEREKLQEFLKEEGISTLIHYPIPVHLQKAYSFLGPGRGSLPLTEKIASEIVSIPLYPELGKSQVKEVAEKINSFYR